MSVQFGVCSFVSGTEVVKDPEWMRVLQL
jgi:hypothetical protein